MLLKKNKHVMACSTSSDDSIDASKAPGMLNFSTSKNSNQY